MQTKQIYHVEGTRWPQIGDYEVAVTTEHFCDTCSQRNNVFNPCLGMLAYGHKWHHTPVGVEDDMAGAVFVVPKTPGVCSWYSFLPKSLVASK